MNKSNLLTLITIMLAVNLFTGCSETFTIDDAKALIEVAATAYERYGEIESQKAQRELEIAQLEAELSEIKDAERQRELDAKREELAALSDQAEKWLKIYQEHQAKADKAIDNE